MSNGTKAAVALSLILGVMLFSSQATVGTLEAENKMLREEINGLNDKVYDLREENENLYWENKGLQEQLDELYSNEQIAAILQREWNELIKKLK